MEIKREELLVDPQKCTACQRCMMACAMKHHNRIDPQLSRVSIFRLEKKDLNVPIICMACDNAPCIKVCPANARVREPNGTVISNTDVCIGCRACVYICPVGSPAVNPYDGKTMTCDMCKDDPVGPWCVAACKEEGALRISKCDVIRSETARTNAAGLQAIYHPHHS